MTAPAQLIIGTAQFGSAYGATNTVGRLSDETVGAILRASADADVRVIDTARGYGDAESRLASWLPRIGGSWRVITKLTVDDVDPARLVSEMRATRARLACDRLDVLLHRPADLAGARGADLLASLRAARDAGVIGQFGVSVYATDELARCLEAAPDLGLVQYPGSIVDRRMLDDPWVHELAANGVEMHVRSVLLQGLLMADPEALRERSVDLAHAVSTIDDLAARAGVSRLACLIGFVRARPAISGVVVGATSHDEWLEILGSDTYAAAENVADFALPVEVLDPRLW